MINPWLLFSLAYGVALISYGLGWSTSYSHLNSDLFLFLVCVIVLFAIFGFVFGTFAQSKMESIEREPLVGNSVTRWFITLGILAEGVYSKGFPLTGYIGGHVITYADYGIPTFHVVLITISCFYALLSMNDFLDIRINLKTLCINFLFAFVPTILTYNRGMIMMTGVTMIFLFFIKRGFSITPVKGILFLVAAVVGIFAFGISGNYRINSNYGRPDLSMTDSDIILNQGNASKEFLASSVPKSFFWTYIYTASPLGNLNNTVEHKKDLDNLSPKFTDYFVTQFFPDMISKRLVNPKKIPQIPLVIPQFNVSTSFSGSFFYFGWIGMIFFTLLLFILPFIYLILLKSFAIEYYQIGVAMLCTIYCLMFFGNFFSFTGLMVQLMFPFALKFLSSRQESFFLN